MIKTVNINKYKRFHTFTRHDLKVIDKRIIVINKPDEPKQFYAILSWNIKTVYI